MKLTLELPEAALVGESAPARLLITNDGPAPAEVPDPRFNAALPALEVRDPAGATRTFLPGHLWAARGELHFPREGEGPLVTLAPGATLEHAFALLDRCELPRAGRYELAAVAGADRSPPARLAVQPVTPGAVVPEEAPLDGGDPTWLAWTHEVEGSEEAPGVATLLLRRVALSELGELELLAPSVRLGQAAAGVRPVLSTPPTGEAATERHVAWTSPDGTRLTAVTVAPAGQQTTATLGLEPRGVLLGPPVAEFEGGASLLLGLEGSAGCELAVVRLRGASATIEHRRLAGRQQALWGRLVAPPEAARRALVVVPDRTSVRLLTLPWVRPDRDAVPVPAEVPTRLLELPGRFAAADAVLDGDGVVRGALLAWAPRPLGGERLMLARWSLDRSDLKGGLRAERPTPWDWPERLLGAPLQARVDRAGVVHLLVQDEEGSWSLARQLERPARLVAPREEGEPFVGPPGIAFVTAGPVALWHRPSTGLVARGVGFRLEADPAELIQPDLLPEPAGTGGGA